MVSLVILSQVLCHIFSCSKKVRQPDTWKVKIQDVWKACITGPSKSTVNKIAATVVCSRIWNVGENRVNNEIEVTEQTPILGIYIHIIVLGILINKLVLQFQYVSFQLNVYFKIYILNGVLFSSIWYYSLTVLSPDTRVFSVNRVRTFRGNSVATMLVVK